METPFLQPPTSFVDVGMLLFFFLLFLGVGKIMELNIIDYTFTVETKITALSQSRDSHLYLA